MRPPPPAQSNFLPPSKPASLPPAYVEALVAAPVVGAVGVVHGDAEFEEADDNVVPSWGLQSSSPMVPM